jgi:hypothetical protein
VISSGCVRGGALALVCWFGALTACGGAPVRRGESAGPSTVPVYDYVAIDGRRFSTEGNLGKVVIVVVIATYDLASQVVMRELMEAARRERRAVAAAAVVLEPPKNAPLAEAFAATLELPFPVAMADQATLEAHGPFGAIGMVPTIIVISPDGREVWRKEGAVSAGQITRSIAAARRGAATPPGR